MNAPDLFGLDEMTALVTGAKHAIRNAVVPALANE